MNLPKVPIIDWYIDMITDDRKMSIGIEYEIF